jgi:hypothetical protein
MVYRFSPGPASIHELSQNTGGSIYPNPSNGLVYFKTAKDVSDASIKVTNLVGQVVYERTNISLLNGQKINLDTQLPSGIYHIQLITKAQDYMPTKLIIK